MIWTEENQKALEGALAQKRLGVGLGDKSCTCAMGEINLAYDRQLTDRILPGMCRVLATAVMSLQDIMPDDMRNSVRFKTIVAKMPAVTSDKEQERLTILMDWMWGKVLPLCQVYADQNNFGQEWRAMCDVPNRSIAADAADAVAYAVWAAAGAAARHAADAADAAAAWAAADAAYAASYAAADAAARAAADAACAAMSVSARDAADAAKKVQFIVPDICQQSDVLGLLESMVDA